MSSNSVENYAKLAVSILIVGIFISAASTHASAETTLTATP